MSRFVLRFSLILERQSQRFKRFVVDTFMNTQGRTFQLGKSIEKMRSLFVIPFWAEAGMFRHNSILAVWSLWTAHCRYLLCEKDEKSPDNKGRRLVWSRGLSKIQMQTIVFFGDRHLRLFWLASVTHLMLLKTITAFLRNKTEEGI